MSNFKTPKEPKEITHIEFSKGGVSIFLLIVSKMFHSFTTFYTWYIVAMVIIFSIKKTNTKQKSMYI